MDMTDVPWRTMALKGNKVHASCAHLFFSDVPQAALKGNKEYYVF